MKNLIIVVLILAVILFVVSAIISVLYPNNPFGDVLSWIFLGSIALLIISGIELMIFPISRRNRETKAISLFLLISAFTFNLNAQNIPENEYITEMVLESFYYENSFVDPVTGIEFFSEVYGFENSDIKLGISIGAYIRGNGKNNFLWLGLFDEDPRGPFICEIFSYHYLEKIYMYPRKKGSLPILEGIWRGFSISIPFEEEDEIPGEYIIISGEVLDEEGRICTFEIKYPSQNLFIHAKRFWSGFPRPEKPLPSKIGRADCEVIKLKNSSLDYLY